jgi:hypothetical protein
MDHDKTIYEQFKEAELREKESQKTCLEAIKKIRAEEGYVPALHTLPRRGPAGAGNIAKFSPNGRLIGWYRHNQRSGKPSRLMPVEQALEREYQAYKKSVISAFPQQVTATVLGRRSGQVRKEHGLSEKIISMQQALIDSGTKKHHHAQLIAKGLNCSTEYVRRTLRKSKL